MDVHPAVLAGAHQRVSALSLLRDAFPFRGHAVPIAVVAAAVAPFMAPAHFDPQTYPERISVLNVQVKPPHGTQPVVSNHACDAVSAHEEDSTEEDNIARTLCVWRPLKALALGTGGRIAEVLHVGRILALQAEPIVAAVDLTQLRSLTFANCIITPNDIAVLAARATALKSLQLGMAHTMSTAESDKVMAQVFSETWQGRLTSLMLAPDIVDRQPEWARMVVAAERASASRHPCAVSSTLEKLRINGLVSLPEFRCLVAACNPSLRRLQLRGVTRAGYDAELIAAACCGSVAKSSLEHCTCLFRVSDVAHARRKLKRMLRSDPSRALNPPTLEELGLSHRLFSQLTVMPRALVAAREEACS